MKISEFFKNDFKIIDGVHIFDTSDEYAENFGKQWKEYRDLQIDSINNFSISKDYLLDLTFNDLKNFKNKNVLEIGSGAGRFTEIIVNNCKFCISVDLSSAIFHNVSKGKSNLILVKSDFLKLIPNNFFDVVICRGVLQHTKSPKDSINKLYDFVKTDGFVYFDIYKKPFLGRLNPKYIFWRPLIRNLISYEKAEKILKKRVKVLIKIKEFLIKYIVFKKSISDVIIPIWYYKGELNLSNNELEKWAILDTLDGLFAHYDQPMSNKEVILLLKKNNIELISNNKVRNFFKSKKKFSRVES